MIDSRDSKFFVEVYEDGESGTSINKEYGLNFFYSYEKGDASAAGGQGVSLHYVIEPDACGTSFHMHQLMNCSFIDYTKPSFGTTLLTKARVWMIGLSHGSEQGFSPTGDNNHNN